MNKEEREVEIDLLQMLKALWENVKYIIIVTVILGVVGFVGSKFFLTPIYEASAKMIVNTQNGGTQIVTNDQLNSAKNLVDTYAIIIRSRDVLNQVISELNLTESYEGLVGRVSVRAVNNTQIMQVTVQHEDRAVAYAIAEKILDIAPEVIVKTVEAGSAKPVEQVYAGLDPVSPSEVKNAVIAAFLGMVLSCVVIIIKFLLDNTYKNDMDIQRDLDLPVLGIIPAVESCKRYSKGHSAKGRR